MKVSLKIKDKEYQIDLSNPHDLSIPLTPGTDSVNCFYAPPMKIEPVIAGDFIGSTDQGSPVNFKNVFLNPHGNGTHTECVGHIAKQEFTINQCLKNFHFLAKLVTITPCATENGDQVITLAQIRTVFSPGQADAIIIRTLPNQTSKKWKNYSGTNPPYFDYEAINYLVGCGVQHLLIDLPSVDREQDGGKVLGHHAFWKYPDTEEKGRSNCTITELIFVDDAIKDGYYLLNLLIASFELDASPSKPIIYDLI